MLWYVPLEPYKERYTGQLHDWMVTAFANNGVRWAKIAPSDNPPETAIKTGQVLDAQRRVHWATDQVKMLVNAMADGTMKDGDTVLLMDFWHPGIDGLFYALHLYDLRRVRVYAYCWAQSVDQYDFTHPMRHWMRPIEQGIGNRMAGVFVADDGLKELLETAGIAPGKVVTVGLPFDSQMVMRSQSMAAQVYVDEHPKHNQVVYSSRFDEEKDPLFFVQVARDWRKRFGDDGTKFVMCTSADNVRSNSEYVREAIMKDFQDGTITLMTGLTKRAYYDVLLESKVQFNCALQDWVSFTLLEAVTFGCYPVYPMRRSFPEALGHEPSFLYRPADVDEAIDRIRAATVGSFYSGEDRQARRDLILSKHDQAINLMIWKMGGASEDKYDMNAADDGLARYKAWRSG